MFGRRDSRIELFGARRLSLFPDENSRKPVFYGVLSGHTFWILNGAAPHHRNALLAGAGIAAFRVRSRCVFGPLACWVVLVRRVP